MVRARGPAQRTRSPLSRRKNSHRGPRRANRPCCAALSRTGRRNRSGVGRDRNRRARAKRGGGGGGAAGALFAPRATRRGGRQPAARRPAGGHPTMRQPDDTRHFPALPAAIDLPALEHEMLRRWQDGKVFERSLERTADGPMWTFYEGPPTANGTPGVHHIEARVFKDVFPRFKTMQGFHVPRQGGWDCHGLPVEVAVEKELGLSGKKDIEGYGIAAFNERCRESVLRYVDEFEDLTDRLGYWVDLARAYRTIDPDYIQSVWWSLHGLYDEALMVMDDRIHPVC